LEESSDEVLCSSDGVSFPWTFGEIDVVLMQFRVESLSIAEQIFKTNSGDLPVVFIRKHGDEIPTNFEFPVVNAPVKNVHLIRLLENKQESEEENQPIPREIKRELDKVKILVAEDNVVNQKVVKSMLSKVGCEVFIVGDGKQAFEERRSQTFDLILMDWQMPVMDGIEATKSIRQFEIANQLQQIPIIALTADGTECARQICLNAGMNDYLLKPFSPSQLSKTISKFVRQ